MSIMSRISQSIKDFLQGMFSYEPKSPKALAQQVIREQKQSQSRLSESLTDLIFQRKKFESRLKDLENRKLNLKEDLQVAAMQDRDELAMHLMEELDFLVKEIEETQKNLDLVIDEIQNARQVEKELSQQIKRSEAQLAVLVSRSQSVKMREDLQSQFAKIHQEISHMQPGFTGIEESIMKLESKLENMQGHQQDWKKELTQMRKERTDHFRKARLEQLKMQLKSRSLPGRIIIPEVVNTH